MISRLKQFKITEYSFILLFFITLLTIAYWPAIHLDYLFHDDFYYFTGDRAANWLKYHRCEDYSQFDSFFHLTARPLAGYLRCFEGKFLNVIPDGKNIREFNLIILSICTILSYKLLTMCGIRRHIALITAALIALLTPYQTPVAQITNGYHLFAAVLSLTALIITLKATNNKNKKTWFLPLLISFILMVSSLLIYPPSSMLFWSYLAIYFIFSVDVIDKDQLWKFSLLSAPVILAMGVPKLWAFFFGYDGRGGFPGSLLDKGTWFTYKILPLSFSYWNAYPSTIILITSAAILTAFSLVLIYQTINNQKSVVNLMTKGIVCLLFVIMTFIPNLLVGESAEKHRLIIAIKTLLFMYVFFSVVYLIRFFTRRYGNVLSIFLITGLLGAATFITNQNIAHYYAQPSNFEYTLLRNKLLTIDFQQLQRQQARIHFVTYQLPPSMELTDEFGMLSTYWDLDTQGYFVALASELNINVNVENLLNGKLLTVGNNNSIRAPENYTGKPIGTRDYLLDVNKLLCEHGKCEA